MERSKRSKSVIAYGALAVSLSSVALSGCETPSENKQPAEVIGKEYKPESSWGARPAIHSPAEYIVYAIQCGWEEVANTGSDCYEYTLEVSEDLYDTLHEGDLIESDDLQKMDRTSRPVE